MLLIDTDILIDAAREDKNAKQFIATAEKAGDVGISAITQMELLAGARNKDELREIAKFIRRFTIINLDEDICNVAVLLLTTYRLRFGLGIADALIAATAKARDLVFATRNRKDFQFIEGLNLAIYP